MSSSFSFPPPPPPPPKTAAPIYEGAPVSYSQNGVRHNRGGRGGHPRGRGRGSNQHGSSFGNQGHGGYSDGGARFPAQTPMTGVSGPQQFAAQLSAGSYQGYGMPQYPQWQLAAATAPVQSAFQFPPLHHAFSQPTMLSAGYAGQNTQNSLNQSGSPLNGYNVHHPTLNTAGYNPQAWLQPVGQFNNVQQAMGPPIRLGFDADHPQNVGRDVYQTQGHFLPPRPNGPNQHAGNKRKRQDSRDKNGSLVNGQRERPKTLAPPAVPSFGPQLPNHPGPPSIFVAGSSDHGQSKSNRNKKKRKFNQLGLTPRTEEHEHSEEENVDEEAAAFADKGQELQFKYRGQTSTLGSSSDIAAWIEQRRQLWPTKGRVEEKKQAAAQRTQEQAELRRKAHESQRKDRQKERKLKTQKNDDEQRRKSLEKHLKKAERLQKELEKSEKKAAARAAQEGKEDEASSVSSSTSSTASESSSDTDDITDNEAPEEASSKGKGPVRVAPPDRKSKRVCTFFLKSGRCKRGDRCQFRHELPERGAKQSKREKKQKKAEQQQKPKRVSLHQRLVEQEQRAENELALQAIKYLGRKGFFEGNPEAEKTARLSKLAVESRSVDSPADSFAYQDELQDVAEANPQVEEHDVSPRLPPEQLVEVKNSPELVSSKLHLSEEADYILSHDISEGSTDSDAHTAQPHQQPFYATVTAAGGSWDGNEEQDIQHNQDDGIATHSLDIDQKLEPHHIQSISSSQHIDVYIEPAKSTEA